MSTDNFQISLDPLPVATTTKTSRSDAPASRNGSTPGGFRELLSDSMVDNRGSRRPERRDDPHASSRPETLPTDTTKVDQASGNPPRRPRVDEEANGTSERPKVPKAVHNKDEDRNGPDPADAADQADLADKLDHADDRAVITTHAAEGTPPAEFVAALLATETTTATAASPPASFDTTTITVQTPPDGLVTALTAAPGGPATDVLTQIQQADVPAGPEVAAEQSAATEQPAGDVVAAGPPVENSQPLIVTPAVADAAETTSTSDSAQLTPPSDQATNTTPPEPVAENSPQVPQGENTAETASENGGPPPQNLPQKSDAQTPAAVQQQIVNINTDESASADSNAGAATAPPEPAQNVSHTTGKPTSNVSTAADAAASQQPAETVFDDQQSRNGSSDHQSQRQPADNSAFTELMPQAGESASPHIVATAVEDSSTDQKTVESAVAGPSPTPPRTDSTRTTLQAATTATESAVDVDRPDFAMRVAQAVRNSADNRQQVTLRLTPPELGALQIEVAVDHGKVSARIDAQSAAAQKILQDSLPQLKEALTHHGTSVERLEVSLADNSPDDRGSAMGQGFAGQGERGNAPYDEAAYRQRGFESAQADESLENETPASNGGTRRRGTTELDVTI